MFRGFLAGVAGGILMNLYGLAAWLIGFSEAPFWKWAAIIILGSPDITGFDHAIGLFAHIIFTGALGIIFAYLVPAVKSRMILFKGWLYGVAMWFVIYTISHLFRVQGTFPIELKTAASNVVGASIFGLVVAWSLTWLENRKKIS